MRTGDQRFTISEYEDAKSYSTLVSFAVGIPLVAGVWYVLFFVL
jgi:hypothetical protein